MGNSGTVDLNCSQWIWSWALQVSQRASCTAQGLWNFDIVDFACNRSYWLVCACQGVKVCSLCGKTFFCSVKYCKHFSARSLFYKHFFVSMIGFCRVSWKAFCVCLQSMPSVGLGGSDCGCKLSCSSFLHLPLTAISCDPAHNRCSLIFAMLCGSFAIAFVGSCKLWKW